MTSKESEGFRMKMNLDNNTSVNTVVPFVRVRKDPFQETVICFSDPKQPKLRIALLNLYSLESQSLSLMKVISTFLPISSSI